MLLNMDDERKTSDHSPDLTNIKQVVRHHFSPPGSLYEQLKPQILAQTKRARQDERIKKSYAL